MRTVSDESPDEAKLHSSSLKPNRNVDLQQSFWSTIDLSNIHDLIAYIITPTDQGNVV